jgi:hypothetical protein
MLIHSEAHRSNSKRDCSGLMDFYSTEEPIRTTRSSERGDLPTTIPMPGFRHQSSRLWNSFKSDKTLPKKLLGKLPIIIIIVKC